MSDHDIVVIIMIIIVIVILIVVIIEIIMNIVCASPKTGLPRRRKQTDNDNETNSLVREQEEQVY